MNPSISNAPAKLGFQSENSLRQPLKPSETPASELVLPDGRSSSAEEPKNFPTRLRFQAELYELELGLAAHPIDSESPQGIREFERIRKEFPARLRELAERCSSEIAALDPGRLAELTQEQLKAGLVRIVERIKTECPAAAAVFSHDVAVSLVEGPTPQLKSHLLMVSEDEAQQAGIPRNAAGMYSWQSRKSTVKGTWPSPYEIWKSLLQRGAFPELIGTVFHEFAHAEQHDDYLLSPLRTVAMRLLTKSVSLSTAAAGVLSIYALSSGAYWAWAAACGCAVAAGAATMACFGLAVALGVRSAQSLKSQSVCILQEVHADLRFPFLTAAHCSNAGDLVEFYDGVVCRAASNSGDLKVAGPCPEETGALRLSLARQAFELLISLKSLGVKDEDLTQLVMEERSETTGTTFPRLEARLRLERQRAGMEDDALFSYASESFVYCEALTHAQGAMQVYRIAAEELLRELGGTTS